LPKFTGILSRELICISLPIHIASSILHVKNENYWPGDTSSKIQILESINLWSKSRYSLLSMTAMLTALYICQTLMQAELAITRSTSVSSLW